MGRARILNRFLRILEERTNELADVIVAEHGKVHSDAVGMTVSIGASSVCGGHDQPSVVALLDVADQSLYHSKRTGRNRATMPGGIGARIGVPRAAFP